MKALAWELAWCVQERSRKGVCWGDRKRKSRMESESRHGPFLSRFEVLP